MGDDQEPTVIEGRATTSMTISGSAKAKTRNYFSTWMLRAAKRQAIEAEHLERSNDRWADPHA